MVDTQLEILKSENFALSVIKKLELTQDPEFVGSSRGLIASVLNLLLPDVIRLPLCRPIEIRIDRTRVP